jgi:hypothetical protein
LCLIRTAAWLVPADSRAAWRREWIAELHYGLRTIRERGEEGGRLVDFARGAFQDAAWHRLRDRENFDQATSREAQAAKFCLAALGTLILAIVFVSGFLPETRSVILPLPFADAGRIATVTQGGSTLAVRSGIRSDWVHWWRADSHLIDGAAAYSWAEQTIDNVPTLRAKVSGDFFSVLGARSINQHPFATDAFRCRDCAVLSYDFWNRVYGGRTPESVVIDGRRFHVAGVLDRHFWFLTRQIGVWEISGEPTNKGLRTGVVVKLKPDVSKDQAERELELILQTHGINAWSSLITISTVADRVRSVLGSFALALMLAIGTVLPAVRPNFGTWSPRVWVRAAFFCSKTALLLLAVLLAGLEFTRATSITMLGGTDLATEPLSTWLFLLGCMGALLWSVYDQRRRCPVCLRRFGLAAHIGCPGCVLLNWSGTELVCLEGHGTLHVPEMTSCWQEQDKWTSLDDSVMDLFAKGG